MKLWKVPATVQVVGMHGFAAWQFEPGDTFAECEAQVQSEYGDRVNGRAIGVIVRPLILAHPVSGKQDHPVVWSKAVVWPVRAG